MVRDQVENFAEDHVHIAGNDDARRRGCRGKRERRQRHRFRLEGVGKTEGRTVGGASATIAVSPLTQAAETWIGFRQMRDQFAEVGGRP